MPELTNEALHEIWLLALCLWREARNQQVIAKEAVAWSIRNRVTRPSWWGTDWISCIIKPFQYTSMTYATDPNLIKWPDNRDLSWQACLNVAYRVHAGLGTDPTGGAHSYFDKSLKDKPPKWAKSAEFVFTTQVGDFFFYRRV